MTDPRKTRTNAADSAPGVDDGPAGARAPPVNSKPGGRTAVWIGVLAVCLLVIASFLAPRLDRGRQGDMVTTGATQGEIAQSRAPGAADSQGVNPPVTSQPSR